MATSNIEVTAGSGTRVATHTVSEDAVTKHLYRLVPSNSSGTEIGTNANPIQVGDGGSTISVDDGGSSITVDGTIAATQSGAWNVTNISGTVSLPTGASTLSEQQTQTTALQLIDNIVLTEDAAHSSGAAGVMALAVRNDAGTALAGTSGDYIPLTTDSTGALRVTGSSSGGGTEYTEDAASASDPVGGAVILVRADTPATITSADGDNVAQRGTNYGAAYVTIIDSSGNPVSIGGGTQYDEDTAHSSGDKLTMAGVVRADTAASLANADGDRTALIVDGSGRLHVNVGNSVTVGDGGGSLTVDGTVAATQSGTWNVAALTSITNPVAVTDNSGSLTVDDGGTSLTVDGTITANQGGTWNITNISGTVSLPTGAATAANQSTANTALAAIQTAVETLDNAISGSEMQVDVVTLPGVTQSGTWTVQPGNTANSTPWLVTNTPATSGGYSTFRSIDLDETEEEIKGSAGQLFGWFIFNASSTDLFVKIYNATAASVTVGTTTPVLTIPLPPGGASNIEFSNGVAFSTAITAACTTGVADSDTGAPGANECIANFFYK